MNRGLDAGGTDHHDCGVQGRGEGNDGECGDELYVGGITMMDLEVKDSKRGWNCLFLNIQGVTYFLYL